MLLFGLVHALLFWGDIIGLYGLIAVLVAGAFARDRLRWPAVFGVLTLVAVAVTSLSVGVATDGGAAGAGPGATTDTVSFGLGWPGDHLAIWLEGTLGGVVLTPVPAAAVAGAYLARTTLLSRPGEHVRALATVAALGLSTGFVTALPAALARAGFADSAPAWSFGVGLLGGLAGAAGWRALFGLVAAAVERRRAEPRPWTPVGVVTAVGRRSMTAYLLQSVLFALALPGLRAAGLSDRLTHLGAAGIAVAVWALAAVVCTAYAAAGRQGPTERLLRELVARSERRRDEPAAPAPATR